MDKSRYDNRSDQWRKRSGARRSRALRWASVPRRLIFVTVAAAGALAAQTALRHSHSQPSDLIGPKPAPIAGVASVIDGDTIEVQGQRIRFNGIDAPESKQYCDDAKGFEYPCGRRSAAALDTFLAASRPVQCSFVTWDRYHRFVGHCRRADGAGVAAWMVEHGQAVDWPRYSHGAYAAEQAKAEAAKVGLWVGNLRPHGTGARRMPTALRRRANRSASCAGRWSRRAAIRASRGGRASRSVPATMPNVSAELLMGRQAGSRW